MITRRKLLKGVLGLGASSFVVGGYAFAVEPMWRLNVTRYAFSPPRWPAALKLRVAIVADVHASEPYMPVSRIRQIVARTNALNPDVTLLLGDYVKAHHWETRPVNSRDWSDALAGLRAPLGVHAVLGNHDWWEDHTAQRDGHGPIIARRELERVGIPVYENSVVRLAKNGRPFWLAGLGDQLALVGRRGKRYKKFEGVDDLPVTLAKVTDDAPILLMAHEPDIFPLVPERVSLTISGHTHGGQVRLFGYSPIVPSRYGNRYAYGHVVEREGPELSKMEKHLIVSGGLGSSIMPVRFGVPPEIVMIELGADGTA
jgi:uncharacterized protein